MGLKAKLDGRRAYTAHLAGNRFIDALKFEEAKEKHAQAIQLYETAISEGNDDGNILMAYGVLLMRFGRLEEARDALLKAEKSPSLDAKGKRQLRINYSVCQWKLGNLDKAIELIKNASSGSAMTSMVYTTLGYYLIEKAIQTGDFEEAVAFNQEAYDYDEDDAATLDNLGQLNLAMGKREEAYGFFKRAYEIKPTQVPTLYFIAKMNHEKGDDEKARFFIDKCLEKGNFSALCSVSRAQAEALKAEIG